MTTGIVCEPRAGGQDVAPTPFFRRTIFHPFVVQMLAHLKRETFVEADYPAGVVNNPTNANGLSRNDRRHARFEYNRGFNGHFEFKGKFYPIDDSITLKDPSKLADLERCRKPEFVCGRNKYYKVAKGDRFFDVGLPERVFTTLEDLEWDILKHEYGSIPDDLPHWGLMNPINLFEGTIGCSLYALAVV